MIMCVCAGVGACEYVHLCWFGYTCVCLCREIRVWHQASRLLFPFRKSFLRNITQSVVAILVDYIFALDRSPWKKTWNALPHGWFVLSLSIFSFLNIGELMEMLQWLIHRKRNKNFLEWPWPSNPLSSVVVLATISAGRFCYLLSLQLRILQLPAVRCSCHHPSFFLFLTDFGSLFGYQHPFFLMGLSGPP